MILTDLKTVSKVSLGCRPICTSEGVGIRGYSSKPKGVHDQKSLRKHFTEDIVGCNEAFCVSLRVFNMRNIEGFGDNVPIIVADVRVRYGGFDEGVHCVLIQMHSGY